MVDDQQHFMQPSSGGLAPPERLDKQAIFQAIPHREPFLFVDEVVDLDELRIVTRKLADPEADFFKGHYPGNPVMPGVLLCECCFQAGALLIGHRLGGSEAPNGTPVITRIQDAKFKQLVRPGETLNVEVVLDEEVNEVFFMTGRVTSNGKIVLRVNFAAALLASASNF